MAEETRLIVAGGQREAEIVQMVLDGLASPHSKSAYKRALDDFLAWFKETGQGELSKRVVQRYKTVLEESGLAASSVNLKLSAIRKLAGEAGDNELISEAKANGIARVKGVRTNGVRTGNWLTREQAQKLLEAPDGSLMGLRDKAILGIFLGAALRRSEVAALTFEHIQQRDGRWVILDLVGKHQHVRTVPIPGKAQVAIDAWAQAAGIEQTGPIFRSLTAVKGKPHRVGGNMTAQGIRNVVVRYSEVIGLERIAPHDLRRTAARLAFNGGAPLRQIQLWLGHQSIATTERYLGIEQDLTDAPCDYLGLSF